MENPVFLTNHLPILMVNSAFDSFSDAVQEALHAQQEFDLYIWKLPEMGFQEHHVPNLWTEAMLFNPRVIFLSSIHSNPKGSQMLQAEFKENFPGIPVIGILHSGKPETFCNILEMNLNDFVIFPWKPSEIQLRIKRVLEHTSERNSISTNIKETVGLSQIVGQNDGFLSEIKKIPVLARCDRTVLITGETGTGKDLCARAIHYLSKRSRNAFVPINCGGIPVDLIENELFGHARGAFTGATTSQNGLIQEADEGTLFLDEIDCLPFPAQSALLRFLQEKEYRAIGSQKMKKANVRVLAAMNTDPQEALQKGRLRHDLYYRLNVISLNVPPLRQRGEDILLLARHFLEKFAREMNKPEVSFSTEAMNLFLSYDWPGNVRELEHVIEHAVVLAEDRVIQIKEISLPGKNQEDCQESFHDAKKNFERAYIEKLLIAHGGNITHAARAAQKNRRAFWELMRKYHIDIHALSHKPNSA